MLAELTELTHFALQGGSEDAMGEQHTWLVGPALGKGVAELKALECLCVDHGEGHVSLHRGEGLLDACMGLERLSQLHLLCDLC